MFIIFVDPRDLLALSHTSWLFRGLIHDEGFRARLVSLILGSTINMMTTPLRGLLHLVADSPIERRGHGLYICISPRHVISDVTIPVNGLNVLVIRGAQNYMNVTMEGCKAPIVKFNTLCIECAPESYGVSVIMFKQRELQISTLYIDGSISLETTLHGTFHLILRNARCTLSGLATMLITRLTIVDIGVSVAFKDGEHINGYWISGRNLVIKHGDPTWGAEIRVPFGMTKPTKRH